MTDKKKYYAKISAIAVEAEDKEEAIMKANEKLTEGEGHVTGVEPMEV